MCAELLLERGEDELGHEYVRLAAADDRRDVGITPAVRISQRLIARVAQLDREGPATENLLERAVSTFERNFIIRALEKSRWNVTATARYLGIPLSTLKHKMARLDLRDIARKLRGA